MKLWQRKKAWIHKTLKHKVETYIWHAFFQETTKKQCYQAWNTKHQKEYISNNYNYYNGIIWWKDGTRSKICDNESYI